MKYWWGARQYRGWCIISQTRSKNWQEMNIVQDSGHIHFEHILFFRVSPTYLNLKVVSRIDSEL